MVVVKGAEAGRARPMSQLVFAYYQMGVMLLTSGKSRKASNIWNAFFDFPPRREIAET